MEFYGNLYTYVLFLVYFFGREGWSFKWQGASRWLKTLDTRTVEDERISPWVKHGEFDSDRNYYSLVLEIHKFSRKYCLRSSKNREARERSYRRYWYYFKKAKTPVIADQLWLCHSNSGDQSKYVIMGFELAGLHLEKVSSVCEWSNCPLYRISDIRMVV